MTRLIGMSVVISITYIQGVYQCHSYFNILDSRILGHEARLRSGSDTLRGAIILPDPQQTALRDAVIRSWQIFVQVHL